MAGGDDKPGIVYVPWYATVFRKDSFAAAVAEVAPIALRYGATQYQVHIITGTTATRSRR